MASPTGTGAINATEIPLVPTVITSKWVRTKEGEEINVSKAMPGSSVKISLELWDCEDIGEITITVVNTNDDKAELKNVKAKVNGNTATSEEIKIEKEWACKKIKIKVKKNPFEKEYVGAELEIDEEPKIVSIVLLEGNNEITVPEVTQYVNIQQNEANHVDGATVSGIALRTNFYDGASNAGTKCVMFGAVNGWSSFCAECATIVKKVDLKEGIE